MKSQNTRTYFEMPSFVNVHVGTSSKARRRGKSEKFPMSKWSRLGPASSSDDSQTYYVIKMSSVEFSMFSMGFVTLI
jgi:hypothetical protein